MMSKPPKRASEKSSVVRCPENESRRCAYCGAEAPLVWVHGHGQCASCGINVAECCQGDSCQTTDEAI